MKNALIGLVCLLLTNCGAQVPNVTPQIQEQLLQGLVGGQAVLNCKLSCSGTYGYSRQKFTRLYANGNWAALGTLMMEIGLYEDQSYFYLGRAAEGMGAFEAARKYYQIAAYIATSPDPVGKCAAPMDICDGFSFPRDIYPRLQYVEAAIAQRQMALARPTPEIPPEVERQHQEEAAAERRRQEEAANRQRENEAASAHEREVADQAREAAAWAALPEDEKQRRLAERQKSACLSQCNSSAYSCNSANDTNAAIGYSGFGFNMSGYAAGHMFNSDCDANQRMCVSRCQ